MASLVTACAVDLDHPEGDEIAEPVGEIVEIEAAELDERAPARDDAASAIELDDDGDDAASAIELGDAASAIELDDADDADLTADTYPRDPDNADWHEALSEDPHHHDALVADHDGHELVASDRAADPVVHGDNLRGPSCLADDLTLTRWPVDGTNGRTWLVNNYVDLDAAPIDRRDYVNNTGSLARTYDGHRGVDIDISSFREMDSGSAVVRASAPGVVEFVRENQFDRNTSCTGTWNAVRIRHANGYDTIYGHLKRWSVPVQVGDTVAAGQIIGVTGSSGCSTQPHVHFEVQDCSDTAVESFQLGMWSNPPIYNPSSDIMDVMLRAGGLSNIGQIKDPAPNPSLVAPGTTIGIGLSMAGHGGDQVQLSLTDPNGSIDSWTWTVGGVARFAHLYPYWNKTVGSTPGTWTLRVRVNGSLRAIRSYKVSNYTPGGAEVAKHGVHVGSWQTVFNDITAAGYRPVWIDGYGAGSGAYINAVFRPSNGYAWVARHGLTHSQYQSEFNTWTGLGYRLLHVDSYQQGSAIRYAAIFTKQPGAQWVTYHGVSEATHQALFNIYAGQGYRSVVASVVSINGVRYVTALYDKSAAGSWVALHAIPSSQYQSTFNAQIGAGRKLHYLDAYVHNGSIYYSAVFKSLSYGSWVARHGLTFWGYQTEYNTWTGAGLLTKIVTGAYSGGHRYAGLWTQ